VSAATAKRRLLRCARCAQLTEKPVSFFLTENEVVA